MVALLIRAYTVTPPLKPFISPCISVGTSIIQRNACFTGYGNRYRLKDKITQREDRSFPHSTSPFTFKNVFNTRFKEAGGAGCKHAARGQLLRSAATTAKRNYL